MSDIDLSDQIEKALSEAVAQREDGGVLVRWVLVMETVDKDAARGVYTANGTHTSAWDVLGLLHHGLQLQQMYYSQDAGD